MQSDNTSIVYTNAYNNRWDYNSYHVNSATSFAWSFGLSTFSAWQGVNQDLHGTSSGP